jgi:hypothetical protein
MDRVLDMARGGGEEEMGYPNWFWDWVSWYLTTDRDPKDKPDSAPDKIPEWAWEGQKEIEQVGKRYGMTGGERDWIDWLAGGKKGERPNVPDKIPDRWWDDNTYVDAKT